jgi:hypothetical protein
LLEGCNKPIEPDNIIRVLKAQYDKRKSLGNSQENQVFISKQSKGLAKTEKAQKCMNCKQKGHSKEQCWAKGGGSEGQGPKQCQKKDSQKKKGKEKVHIVKESGSSSEDNNDVAVINSETAFLSKGSSEVTHILNTGASAHMTPHKKLLKDY